MGHNGPSCFQVQMICCFAVSSPALALVGHFALKEQMEVDVFVSGASLVGKCAVFPLWSYHFPRKHTSKTSIMAVVGMKPEMTPPL